MTGEIFIAYAREDTRAKDDIDEILKKMGYTTYVDTQLQGGDEWRKMLEERMRASAAIIVLWSNASKRSAEVTHEASFAIALNRYVPIFVGPIIELAGPFQQKHTLRLASWDRDPFDPDFEKLRKQLADLTRREPETRWLRDTYLEIKRANQRRAFRWIASGAAIVALSAGALWLSFMVRPQMGLSPVPAAEEKQPPPPVAPPQVARDLMAEWAALRAAHPSGLLPPEVVDANLEVIAYASEQGEGDATFFLGKRAERQGLSQDEIRALFRLADEQDSVLGRYEHALILFRSTVPEERAAACDKLLQVSRSNYRIAGPAKGVAEHAEDMLRRCPR